MGVRETLDGAVADTVGGALRPPPLRVELADGGRMLVRQCGNPVLLARVDEDRGGVRVLRRTGYRSPIAPLRADDSRRNTDWPRLFADRLGDSDCGPLHAGRWLFSPRPTLPPYTWAVDFQRDWPACYVDWWEGCTPIVPLRPLSDAEAPRVKAYRRRLREGNLPPVLLWAVTGLDGWLILDGHDRAIAALAEGQEPSAVVLARGSSPAAQARVIDAVVEHQEQILTGTHHREDKVREALAQQLAQLAATMPHDTERTLAWPGAIESDCGTMKPNGSCR